MRRLQTRAITIIGILLGFLFLLISCYDRSSDQSKPQEQKSAVKQDSRTQKITSQATPVATQPGNASAAGRFYDTTKNEWRSITKQTNQQSESSYCGTVLTNTVWLDDGTRLVRYTLEQFSNKSGITIKGSVVFVVSIDKNGAVSSISSPEAFVTGLGLHGFTNCTGEQVFEYETASGEIAKVRGITFLGIRRDSPRVYDIAFVARKTEQKPPSVLKEKERLLKLNPDSVFSQSDFLSRFSENLLWFGKLKTLSDNSFQIITW